MLIHICKSKIAYPTITQTELFYEGSITVDENLLKAADLIPGEKVDVLNMNNGTRIETYVIAGKAGGGEICLNGAAARCGCVGDKIILVSYALAEKQEALEYKMKLVKVDESNKIKN